MFTNAGHPTGVYSKQSTQPTVCCVYAGSNCVHTAIVGVVPRGQTCDHEWSPPVSAAEMCECSTLVKQHRLHPINLNVSMCYSLLLHSPSLSPIWHTDTLAVNKTSRTSSHTQPRSSPRASCASRRLWINQSLCVQHARQMKRRSCCLMSYINNHHILYMTSYAYEVIH